MQTEQEVVAPIIASTSPMRALDVGTGSGRYLPLLASTGARFVIGLDSSLPMLTRKGRPEPGDPVPRVCGDACKLPFRDGSFDLVSSTLMVGDMPDLAAWMGEVARVVAAGGQLIYSDFHPSWATARWRRTFQTADGRSCEIPYFPHSIAEHLALLDARSFDVIAIREPRLVRPEQAAGPLRARVPDMPVVVVFHAVKRA